jgi:signal recognition particle receptor subunit beta
MNILEIPVIGSRKSEKESLYSLLSNQPLRKFEGLDVGSLTLSKDLELYLYFLNQEDDNYLYLWDLIIPYAMGCIVVCDPSIPEIFTRNVEIIEKLESDYTTPLLLCSISELPDEQNNSNDMPPPEHSNRKFQYFNPQDKKSAKDILIRLLESE